MSEQNKITAEQLKEIIAQFSETVFWNNVNPWPAQNEEPYEFDVIHAGEQVVEDSLWIRADFGETRVSVAVLPGQCDGPDAGNVSSEADAKFIARLPVIMPLLLAAAEREAKLREALPKTADGVPIVPGMKIYVAWHDGAREYTVTRIGDGIVSYPVSFNSESPDESNHVSRHEMDIVFSTEAAALSATAKK